MNPSYLKRLRYDAGLTLREAALKSGLSKETVRRAESGEFVTARSAKALADAYGVKGGEVLLSIANEQTPEPPAAA